MARILRFLRTLFKDNKADNKQNVDNLYDSPHPRTSCSPKDCHIRFDFQVATNHIKATPLLYECAENYKWSKGLQSFDDTTRQAEGIDSWVHSNTLLREVSQVANGKEKIQESLSIRGENLILSGGQKVPSAISSLKDFSKRFPSRRSRNGTRRRRSRLANTSISSSTGSGTNELAGEFIWDMSSLARWSRPLSYPVNPIEVVRRGDRFFTRKITTTRLRNPHS